MRRAKHNTIVMPAAAGIHCSIRHRAHSARYIHYSLFTIHSAEIHCTIKHRAPRAHHYNNSPAFMYSGEFFGNTERARFACSRVFDFSLIME